MAANQIYVIEEGHVVQVGTFEELVKLEGLFAHLVARQMESTKAAAVAKFLVN